MPGSDPPALEAEPSEWAAYLRRRGVALDPDAAAARLSGGVSCVTIRVGDLVIKAPRSRLDVPGFWAADPHRILAEAAALARFPGIAPPLVDVDREHLTLTMRFVDGVCWKDELMAGRVDPEVGRIVGTHLRHIHDTPLADQVAADELLGPDAARRFDELRLSPYFSGIPGAVPAAGRAVRAMVERLASTRSRLIHGDYSPKNMLVRRRSGGVEVTVLDWEVATAGDPVFDLAFVLSHLVAKSVHLPHARDDLLATAHAVTTAYGPVDRGWLTVVVGGLLLARVDGLSRLAYLDEQQRTTVRALGVGYVTQREELPW